MHNQMIVVHLKRPEQHAAVAQAIGALFDSEAGYAIVETWSSERGRHLVFNLLPCSLVPRKSLLGSVAARVAALVGRRDAELPNCHRIRVGPDKRTSLKVGYTTTPDDDWHKSLRIRGNRLHADDSGGMAAFCLIDGSDGPDEQAFLWSTRPAVRVLAFAENDDFIVAGTRPRLVHAVARMSKVPDLEPAYVRASLAGWSLGNLTPFRGTTLVPVDALLTLKLGRTTLHGHPTPPFDREGARASKSEAVEEFATALRGAVRPLAKVPFEMRMSGGKDSRLVASALWAEGITPSVTVCHGLPGNWESPVAEGVAKACGWSLRLSQPAFDLRGDVVESVRDNLARAEGFFLSDPRQAAYQQYGHNGQGPGLVIGHVELQRGGWAARIHDYERNIERSRSRLAPYRQVVVPALNDTVNAELDDFLASCSVEDPREYGFWVNYRYRVGRWLTSQNLHYSIDRQPVYPLLDEKVVRLVSGIPIWELASDQLAFSTMAALAPQMRDMPLFNDRYGFEEFEMNERYPDGYDARAPAPPLISGKPRLKPEDALRDGLGEQMCEHITSGNVSDLLRECTTPAMWDLISDFSVARFRTHLDETKLHRMTVAGYIWTCFMASVLFDGQGDVGWTIPPVAAIAP